MQIDDPAPARAALERAESDLRVARIGRDEGDPELEAARERVSEAEALLAACFEPIELQALAPPEVEALLAEHPGTKRGTDGQMEAWGEGFPRALFLACVQGDMGREEWVLFLDRQLSEGEQSDLFNFGLTLNLRVPDPDLPKGWARTLS